MKTVYYYQTFVGLHKLLSHPQDIDIINISSIHFNEDKSGDKQIYLNDNVPYSKLFDQLWNETQLLSEQVGFIIVLAIIF